MIEQNAQPQPQDGRSDFDFYMGTWQVHHRLLRGRLQGSNEWEEFDGTAVARKILGGLGNIDEFVMNRVSGQTRGVTLRLFDPQARQWSIYWANDQLGTLGTPAAGEFEDGRGEFYDYDPFHGRHIFTRIVWSEITPTSCHWEQAASDDAFKTWETNWIMDFTRAE